MYAIIRALLCLIEQGKKRKTYRGKILSDLRDMLIAMLGANRAGNRGGNPCFFYYTPCFKF